MSRLPPPPKGKPLPPDPIDKAPELPPPLPSRPARSGRLPSPPPKSTPTEPNLEIQDDYLEPDDWTDTRASRGPAPALPPRNFDLDGETYEEPDLPAPPPGPAKGQRAPPPRPESGEIYDELEGQNTSSPEPFEQEQENYDACSFEQTQAVEAQQIYEETDEVVVEPIQEDTYEFVPEPAKQSAAPTPPPPPSGAPPMLPNRPPPPKAKAPPPAADNSPELPKRPSSPSAISKLSKILPPGDGPKNAAISLDDLGKSKNRLRKVSSEEKKDVPAPTAQTSTQNDTDTGSVLDRIRKFQDESDSSESTGDDLQNQILNVINSLRHRDRGDPNPKPVAQQHSGSSSLRPRDNKPLNSEPAARPVSGMSIQERMALMQKKDTPPEVSSKPLPAARRQPPDTKVKPKPPLKPKAVSSGQSFSPKNSTTATSYPTTSQTGALQPPRKITPPPPTIQKVPEKTPEKPPPPPIQPVQPTSNHINNNNNNIPEEEYDQDTIYDEGMSYQDPLQGKEWFHADLDRKGSKQKLHSIGEDGTFLVRKATKYSADQPYTLVVLYQGHEYNLKVRMRQDKQVALGEPKEDELAFEDVTCLIEHHQKHNVILVNSQLQQQHQTILKKFPVRR